MSVSSIYLSRSLKAACLVVSLIGAATPSVARQIDSVMVSLSGFEFASNFWAGVFPNATSSGPAPVASVDMSFVMDYVTPVSSALLHGHDQPTVSAFQIAISTVHIPGLSRANDPVRDWTLDLRIASFGTGSAVTHGLEADLDVFTRSGGAANPMFRLKFALPEYFEALPGGGAVSASYAFLSPKPFDLPFYDIDTAGSGAISVSKVVLASSAGPVPLPGSIWLSLGAIGGLLALRRTRNYGVPAL